MPVAPSSRAREARRTAVEEITADARANARPRGWMRTGAHEHLPYGVVVPRGAPDSRNSRATGSAAPGSAAGARLSVTPTRHTAA